MNDFGAEFRARRHRAFQRALRLIRQACLAMLMAALAVPVLASETITYTYDALGRVVAVSRSGGASSGADSTYTYDAAGNRSQVSTSGALSLLSNQSSSEPSQTQGSAEQSEAQESSSQSEFEDVSEQSEAQDAVPPGEG